MTLFDPIWLLLAIPLGVSWWLWKLPSRPLLALRLTILILILLAMCGLALRLPSHAGMVVVVADRSYSMPAGSEEAQKEVIDLIQRAMKSEDRLAVVSFGERAAIERSPQSGKFTGFVNEVGPDASNLAEAIETALSLIPPQSPGRILLLSDGRWTGKDPAGATSRAAAQSVAIDYRALERPAANDVAISHVDAPETVTPGESFMITAWLHSPIQQELSFELWRGNQKLALGKRQVPSGLSRLTFRDQAAEPGTYSYILRIAGSGTDPIPENNTAKVLVGIQGPRPILSVTGAPGSSLARLLQAGRLKVKALRPESCRWTLEDLSSFSAILIENVLANQIGVNGMENIAAWVKESGAGFMMTGGKDAYGPGGYFRSPLEPIMPVSMELKREHRKLAVAIVVAMDRSGSMAAPVGGGKTKMDLANLAAVQVMELLSPMDEFGVVAVDSSPHIIANLAPAENKARLRADILRVDSAGGGIFIFEALSASAQMLLSAQSQTRHILLFADAADSEEPGKYQELLEKCRQANVTVSVIGLGKPTDQDANLLRDIASRGEGRCFFTDNPEELPRLFAQDTFVVARSTFLEGETPIRFTGGLMALTGKRFDGEHIGSPLHIGGYNLCYLRPGANLAAMTLDEYKAPVVAAWQAGSGRVLCYTGEADGTYTGPIAGWRSVGDFFTSMARWTAGDSPNLPLNMLVTQQVRNGINLVQLHLDPEKGTAPFTDLPRVTTLQGVTGAKPAVQKTTMQWTSADTLRAEIPLHGNETSLSTVEIGGVGKVSLSPVSLPYSPEFKPVEAGDGAVALERLAQATGGMERINLTGIWNDLPRQPRLVEMGHWLLILAILLFLLEVLERRTGLLSLRHLDWLPGREPSRVPSQQPVATAQRTLIKQKAREIAGGGQPVREVSLSSDQVESPDMLDALRRARRRAKERTER